MSTWIHAIATALIVSGIYYETGNWLLTVGVFLYAIWHFFCPPEVSPQRKGKA